MNVYKVAVQATGGSHAVVVTVINIDEDGSVSFTELGQVQPQVGRSLEATIADPDMGETDEVWQWARSMDMQTWTDIEGGTSARRSPVAADEGHYLRASVTYTDTFGTGKNAAKVTANAVEERTVSNAAPSFADQDDRFDDPGTANDTENEGIQVNRSVGENTAAATNIGKPVSASDGDNDVLVYTLGGDDAASFSISSSTGQIRTKAALDFEADVPQDDLFNVTVTATDPSGAATPQDVMIELMDVNEAPKFDTDSGTDGNQAPPPALNVVENGRQLRVGATGGENLAPTAYGAADEDADTLDADNTLMLDVMGADAKYFEFNDTGELTIVDEDAATEAIELHTPDFETKSSYSISIVATSGADDRLLRSSVDVTVNVIDAEDEGSVSLTAREPQVGRTIVATVSDDDGGVALRMWTWATLEGTAATETAPPSCPAVDAGNWANIAGVTSGAYTPKLADVGDCLRATATYTDNIAGNVDTTDEAAINTETVAKVTERPVQASNPANTAPKFTDQDLTADGDQSDEAMREVAENKAKENVGGPISAGDGDGDALMYSLSGDDAASFSVDNNGQIKTKVKLDFETKDEYMVALTAMDPSGATDSILVTIMVLDGPDDAVITPITAPVVNVAPAFPQGTANRNVDENLYAGAAVGDPVVADDPGDTVTYSIEGSTYFGIDASSGQITATMMLDEEAMSSHSVTVTATDSEGETDSVAVTINVNDSQEGCDTVGDIGLVNDCEALLDSKDALGGSLNWADDTAMSEWDGVTMSDDRVTAVNLRDQGLDGTISGALGRLSMLTSLNLRSNADLTGEIPGSLNYLTNLTVLNLHSNSHTGEIPDLSGTSLVELYLPGNDLTGRVPAWLNTMTDIAELWLWGNDLSGTLPDLSGMTSLDKLKLNGNAGLTGIDAANLPGGLRWLIAGETNVGATAPDLSGTSLTTLWLNETGLTGAIEVASIPTSVTSLNLKDNALSEIPDMSGLVNLQYLRLQRNDLSGDIPGTMGDLESIERIWAYDNDLTGIAAGFGNAADTLTHLYLDGNPFADGTCLPGDLADVANNDFDAAGLAACQ